MSNTHNPSSLHRSYPSLHLKNLLSFFILLTLTNTQLTDLYFTEGGFSKVVENAIHGYEIYMGIAMDVQGGAKALVKAAQEGETRPVELACPLNSNKVCKFEFTMDYDKFSAKIQKIDYYFNLIEYDFTSYPNGFFFYSLRISASFFPDYKYEYLVKIYCDVFGITETKIVLADKKQIKYHANNKFFGGEGFDVVPIVSSNKKLKNMALCVTNKGNGYLFTVAPEAQFLAFSNQGYEYRYHDIVNRFDEKFLAYPDVAPMHYATEKKDKKFTKVSMVIEKNDGSETANIVQMLAEQDEPVILQFNRKVLTDIIAEDLVPQVASAMYKHLTHEEKTMNCQKDKKFKAGLQYSCSPARLMIV